MVKLGDVFHFGNVNVQFIATIPFKQDRLLIFESDNKNYQCAPDSYLRSMGWF